MSLPETVVFAVIALIVVFELWRTLGQRAEASAAAVPTGVPRWNGIDTAIVGVFVLCATVAYVLKFVYRLPSHSPERSLAAIAMSYTWAAILWAAAVMPGRSQALYQLHSKARVGAAICVGAGTASLLYLWWAS